MKWKIARDLKLLTAAALTGAVGLVVLVDAVANNPNREPIEPLASSAFVLVNWAATLTALALLIGLLSVTFSHFRRVLEQESDWGYSVVLILGMLGTILAGITGIPFLTVTAPELTLAEEPIRWVFTHIYEPLASSLLALLAFFSLSAALRAMRQRRIEALATVGIALFVLLTQLGPVAMIPFLGGIIQWVNDYVVLAGVRGLLLGVSLGVLVASMRVLLGFDQPYLDR